MALIHSQSQLAERGRYAVSVAPEIIRRELDTERYAQLWLSGFESALRQGRRDAQRLYVELLEMVGANQRLLDSAMSALGATMDFARGAITLRQSVEGMDEAGALELYRAALVEKGWTCLPPSAAVNGNGATNGATEG